MAGFEKAAVLEHEVEARLVAAELEARGIPHVLQSYHDQAYDGVFQLQRGWGTVLAPREFHSEIRAILRDLRSAARKVE